MPAYPKGAEWRVWDLQVHTPFSELNNGFGHDFDTYATAFFTQAIAKNVAVVGVTDYFSIEGYARLRELQADGPRLASLLGPELVTSAQGIKLFANVELRTDILVNGNRVNYHVIFSDAIPPAEIRDNFLSQLHFTSEGNPAGIDQQMSLTIGNLTSLGQRLKSQHATFQSTSDLFVGMMQATVDHKQISTVLSARETIFKNRYVFCVPSDEDLSNINWDGQGHNTRKVLIQKAHLLFASNPNTRLFALGHKHPSREDYLREFRTFKPCIHGSDAHTIATLFEPAEGRLTWIKADPTFEGLLQTLNEPDERVFVGRIPDGLQRLATRPTKIVTSLSILRKPGAILNETWFNHTLTLNSELVAIIGNKGSGKSALADVLGLIGNTPRHDAFSFLSPGRFRDRKNNKARHFEASATWADGKLDGPVSLDSVPQPGAVETIKYIPQDYLERICNEVSLGSGSKFYEELQNVIFSHVPEAEQLGCSSLDELLARRSEETKRSIDLLVDQLRSLNREIALLEEQLTPQHRSAIQAQISAKEREIEAHEQTKPKERAAPAEDKVLGDATDAIRTQLTSAQSELAGIEGKVATARKQLIELTKRRSTAERLIGKVDNIARHVQAAEADAKPELDELGLRWDSLVKIDLRKDALDAILGSAKQDIETIQAELAPEGSGLAFRQRSLQGLIAALSQQLSEPLREYEEYKRTLKQWDEARLALIGNSEALGSLEQLKAALNKLPDLDAKRSALEASRLGKTAEIFKEKIKLRNDYGRYYGAVQRFLTEHPLASSQQFKLTFNVAVTEQGFATNFLKMLNQRRLGTFSGLEEGAERLKQTIEATSFDDEQQVISFGSGVIRALRTDLRPGRSEAPVDLRDQLAQGVTATDVYDFVFGLSYLEPVYNLRWDGKTLEQLSPGERGNLLLIFYLLIDRDDIPLVIDQPEENLDNNTVFRTLVPCVKEAKKRRQIVMVTHNPNLAVVCDAEQIVCADIHKDANHRVDYISGSIENPVINKRIVDILEGTRPAFDKRDSKYLPPSSI